MKRPISEHDRSAFEPCGGQRPYIVMSRHASDGSIALEVSAGFGERVAVWNEQTGKIIWCPDGVVALCWLPDGRRILGVTNRQMVDPDAEHAYSLDLWTWPERELVASWPLGMPGWCHDLVISPDGLAVAMTWLEQDGAGFFYLPLDKPAGEECQQEGADYEYTEGNLLVGPVFSPDGKYLVATCSRRSWWAPEGDPETPSPGGRFVVGQIVVFDCARWTYRGTEVEAEAAEGWQPAGGGDDILAEMMSGPEFVDANMLRVALPTGEMRSFMLADAVPL